MTSPAPAFSARHLRVLWVAFAAYLGALAVGVVNPGSWLPAAGQAAWILLWGLCLLHLGVHLLRGHLTLSPDGVLTRRIWRTRRVDVRDLVAIHARGDVPYNSALPATVGFEDRRGDRVDVAFRTGWAPPRLVWAGLAEVIERSDLPVSGIAVGQLEVAVHRRLEVVEANRRALADARDALRDGRLAPHRARGGLHATVGALGAAALLALLVWAAGRGMVPPHDVGRWQLILAVAAALVVLGGILLPTRTLAVTADGVLTRRGPCRRRQVALLELVSVRLVPDRPFLQRTSHGRRPLGSRTPSLHLRDASGRRLRISLGAHWWRGLAPVLRCVLAAAEERGIDLSPHARHELEYRAGVLPGPEWVTRG